MGNAAVQVAKLALGLKRAGAIPRGYHARSGLVID